MGKCSTDDTGSFVKDMKKRMRAIALLSLVGISTCLYCNNMHYCNCGHLPLPVNATIDYINDICWITCFSAIFIFSIWLRAKRKVWFLSGSALLLVFQIPFLNQLWPVWIFQLLIMIMLTVYSVGYLRHPDQYRLFREPAP